jgi:uncharacterized protein YegL
MPANRVQSAHPWHVVLILDDSGSMSGAPADDLNKAIKAMIDEFQILSMGVKPYFKVSIISFGSDFKVLSEAQSEQQVDVTKVSNFNGESGSTNAAAALDEACNLLARNPGKDTDFTPFVFFMSDGNPDDESAAIAAGNKLKSLSIPAGTPRVVTIGLGSDVNDSFMQKLASNSELYKHVKDSKEIIKLFPAIGTIAGSATGAAAVEQAFVNI